MQNIIETLSEMLESVTDQDGAYVAYDLMYKAKFRSVAVKVSSIFPDTEEGKDDFDDYFSQWGYDADLLICELCNYKGEGSGFAFFRDVERLPVFQSKDHSRAYFGA